LGSFSHLAGTNWWAQELHESKAVDGCLLPFSPPNSQRSPSFGRKVQDSGISNEKERAEQKSSYIHPKSPSRSPPNLPSMR